jgi:hypothetical protein
MVVAASERDEAAWAVDRTDKLDLSVVERAASRCGEFMSLAAVVAFRTVFDM